MGNNLAYISKSSMPLEQLILISQRNLSEDNWLVWEQTYNYINKKYCEKNLYFYIHNVVLKFYLPEMVYYRNILSGGFFHNTCL